MFDIGFWELLLIAVVMILAVGPERMPEVARKIAFLVRKLREALFRIRTEMEQELANTPFEEINQAQQEMKAFKNDIRQVGRDLAQTNVDDAQAPSADMENTEHNKARHGE